ncbi:hypothetical protein V0288_24840 [Pannus brasiliensis CCIBt3594]|uniref:Uncharacterized protein n=1 Tax=Pannus brasiliensis CCIBt3594 TaxID=1427578 RepID=A0AAW9R1D6_9CHRO
MTEPTTNKILDDLLSEIKPYASDLGLYALTIGQALSLSMQCAVRARDTEKESQSKLSKWLLSQVVQNQPEIKPIIEKYEQLLSQVEDSPK